MTITQTVFNLTSQRPQGSMLIVPSIAMRRGQLARPSPFRTADQVFTGTVADVARRFLASTPANAFHLVALDGDASSAEALAAACEVKALGAQVVLLEGGLTTLEACARVAVAGPTPVADEAILGDPELTPEAADARLPRTALFGVRGDDDAAFERVAQSLERGLYGAVHHSRDAAVACELARRASKMPFFSREPAASPETVEEVVAYHRALYHGGVANVIVDGEWYVDYNTMGAPFDLLR